MAKQSIFTFNGVADFGNIKRYTFTADRPVSNPTVIEITSTVPHVFEVGKQYSIIITEPNASTD